MLWAMSYSTFRLLSQGILSRLSSSRSRPLSTAGSWKSRSANVAQMIRNDPFVKLSLSLFVIVLGGTAGLEVYNKFKKRSSKAALVHPPAFGHYAVRRTSLVEAIAKQLKKAKETSSIGCPTVYITGLEGCGKTQLLHQFSHHFFDSHQYKWLGLKRVDPMVIYLDATSTSSLSLSIAVAMNALGIKQEATLDHNINTLMECLKLQQVPWLLMVDGCVETDIAGNPQRMIWNHLESCTTELGSVLVTCTDKPSSAHTVNLSPRLDEGEAVELLTGVSGMEGSSEELTIVQSLCCHPLATALAAATIHSYQELWHFDSLKAMNTYSLLIKDKLQEEQSPVQATLSLYSEVMVADARMRHVFDLLGSVDLNVPVMTSLISDHIQSSFYSIPKESQMDGPVQLPLEESPDSSSYWNYLKSIKESVFPSQPVLPTKSVNNDAIAFLRRSPILSFSSSYLKNCELVLIHSSAASCVRGQFAARTCTLLDEEHCKTKEDEFQRSSWWKRYKTFNRDECLASFHRSLPGLSSPGVITARQFASSPPSNSSISQGTTVDENLSYSQYAHIVSHYHRVLKSLASTLQNSVGDISDSVLQSLMMPHLQVLKGYPLIAEADKVTAQILEADAQALSLSETELEPHLRNYEGLVNKQKKLLGSTSLTVSNNLTKYADMLLSSGRPSEARIILQTVLATYKNLSSGMRDQQCVEIGHAMSSLGRAYAQLREHQLSKDWFEQALASFQTVPEEGGEVTNRQRKLISSSLIDVAQAYLIIGDLPVAKKYSELACMVLDSIYPEGNSETIRCLKIGSIVNALGGDKDESIKQKTRASKIEGHL